MPWARFTADFDWRPTSQATIAYKAGHEVSVTTACLNAAKAAGAAVKIATPRRELEPEAQDPEA